MDEHTVINQIQNDNVRFIQLHFTDLLGHVKSVTIPASKLEDSFKHGTWFDGSSIEGFARIAESDMVLKPDINTYSLLPWLNSEDGNTARFICDVYMPNGEPFEGDPRYILKRALEEAKNLGYEYNTGPELEFFLFKRNENGNTLEPNDKAGYFDMTTDEAYEVRREMTVMLEKCGVEVETAHHEVAIGQHEINFRYNNALKTADSAITLKVVLKAIAEKHGLYTTFMPKPIEGENGSGMHVHQSLWDIRQNKNAFHDSEDKYGLSPIAYNFIAGQLTHAKALAAVTSPTVNSYKRLVPGYEAPVYLSWAQTNRSALIRIPMISKGKEAGTRCELRCPDPTANPYLAFAVMLQAGLDGLKNNLTPPEASEENLYNLDENGRKEKNIETLPESLGHALKAFEKNQLIKDSLGEHTFTRFKEAKTKEWNQYRLHVSEWELEHYLDQY